MSEVDDVVMEPEDGEGNEQSASGKLKDLREELKQAKKERDEYLDSLQRMKADYVNAKRRFEEDKKAVVQYAAESIVLELLPIVDSLEAALAHEEGSASEAGIKNIKNQLVKLLEQSGAVAFDPTGQPFDPVMHEPVETVAVKDESEDNVVTKVHQKGYTLHGRTVRPARVAVGHYQK